MSIEQIRQLRRATPFRPFVLVLENGKKLLIDEPQYLAIAPDGNRLLFVNPNDKAEWFGTDRVREAFVANGAGAA